MSNVIDMLEYKNRLKEANTYLNQMKEHVCAENDDNCFKDIIKRNEAVRDRVKKDRQRLNEKVKSSYRLPTK